MKRCIALIGGIVLSLTAVAQEWSYTKPAAPFQIGTTDGASDMALAPDHTPYATFTYWPNYRVKAMKYNGTDWVDVGGDISGNGSYEPSIAIDANAVPFVAYSDGAAMGKATVKKFDGTNWVTVGQAGFSTGSVDEPQMEINNDGTPYVAFKDNAAGGKATVMKFNGTSWIAVGTPGFSSLDIISPGLAFHPDGTPYLGYLESSGKGTVVKYDGTQWVTVGSPQFTPGTTGGLFAFSSFDIDDQGTPYFAFSDLQHTETAIVMKFTGTEWVLVGANGASEKDARFVKIALHNQTPYVAYIIDYQSNPYAVVYRYNGTEWIKIGTNSVQGSNWPNLAIYADGAEGLVYYLSVGYGSLTSPMIYVSKLVDCVPPPGNTTPASSLTVCRGSTTTLSAEADGSLITWYDEAGSILGTGNQYTTTALTGSTKFYAGASKQCGSSARIAIPVTVSSPAVTITGTTTICNGASTTLTAAGAVTYAWSNGPNTAAHAVSPGESTTYTVTGKDVNNCSSTASQLVTVHSLPTITVTGTTTICSGTATTLTAAGAASYTWNNGPNTAAFTVSPGESTTYTVTGKDANNCSSTASQLVIVHSSPTMKITGTTSICSGAATTLMAAGADSYVWSNGPNTAAYAVSPKQSTTYTVTGKNANNCSSTVSQLVTVHSLPTITITGTTTICSGTATTLMAAGADSYVWSSGPNTAAYAVSPEQNTTYTVTGKDANNCSSTASKEVTVKTVNKNISVNGITLVAEANLATYQWINCDLNALIIGATGKTFTPELSGNYAVMVSQNLCVRTSDCLHVVITGTQAMPGEQMLNLYPNPSKGVITAKGAYEGRLKVINSLGQVVLEFELNEDNDYSGKLNLRKGVYYINFTDRGNNVSTQKIIISE